MFCPGCHCEFRPGFTRCQSCDVDLVESLDAAPTQTLEAPTVPLMPAQMADVCGFLDLNEARHTRDRFHREGITSEIVIRAAPETPAHSDVVEEYWLRADAQQAHKVKALLDGPTEAAAPGDFKCSNCDLPVRREESFCANCGLRFKE